MKNGNKLTVSLALLLAANIVAPAANVQAKSFSDVSTKHWAYTFIDELSDKKIINGYEDGTFKPDAQLSYLEMLSLLAGMVPLSQDEMVEASKLYSKDIEAAGLNASSVKWAIQPTLTVLYRKIIDANQLQNVKKAGLITPGTTKKIPRSLAAIYIGRALSLDKIADAKPFASLPYKDTDTVPKGYEKLVATMIEVGILSKDGDGKGNFNGNGNLKRSEAATLMHKAYKYKASGANTATETPKPNTTVAKKNMSGYIVSVSSFNADSILGIAKSSGAVAEKAVRVTSDSVITLDGRSARATDLVVGMKVYVEFEESSSVVTTIKSEKADEVLNGVIRSVNTRTGVITIVEDNSSAREKDFTLTNTSKIYINDSAGKVDDLIVGETVKITHVNGNITELRTERKTGTVSGIIKAINEKNNTATITILEKNKKVETTYGVDSKAYIERKREKVKLSDLRIGDEVDVKLDKGIATDISAYVTAGKFDGIIVSIVQEINKPLKIVIKDNSANSSSEGTTYQFASGVKVYIDDKSATMYDLKVGQRVNGKTEGGEIVEIDANSKVISNFIVGKIVYINNSKTYIEIDVDKSDETKLIGEKDFRVDIGDKTSVPSYLSKGDYVIVFGTYDGTYFIADRIDEY